MASPNKKAHGIKQGSRSSGKSVEAVVRHPERPGHHDPRIADVAQALFNNQILRVGENNYVVSFGASIPSFSQAKELNEAIGKAYHEAMQNNGKEKSKGRLGFDLPHKAP